MPSTFPVGEQIIQISGLLEREDDYIHAKHYTAVLTFADESVALLAQNSIVRIAKIPDDTCDLPAQFIDCKETVVNCTVTNAFVMHKPLKNPYASNGPQLFLVLDQERMMGIVPTQRGSLLHIENIMSSPLFRAESRLTSPNGEPMTMEELVGF